VEFCRAVAQVFKELGDRHNRGVCRMRYLVEQMGAEAFEEAVRERCTVDLRERGTDLTEGYTGDHVGVHDQRAEFAEAARAARRYGTDETTVRLATDQNFLITHVPEGNVDDLLAEPFAEDYQPDPGPFSRGAVGCTGSEFCNYGIVETKNRTKRWARELDDRIDTPEDLDVVRVHLSGCSASCAQPQIADVGLRGETVKVTGDGEGDLVEGMDLGLGGSLGADNAFLNWVENAVPATAVIPALEELFAVYADERTDGERFYQWCRRVGDDRLRSVMQRADANVAGGVPAETDGQDRERGEADD
jgi:ferredoxin-nitrite reductase